MKVSFKYLGQSVFMDDSGDVICTDKQIKEIFDTSQDIEAFKLAGDVTQSPVYNVLQLFKDDITDLQIIPTETIN